MNTATYSRNTMENLWNYLQGLALPASDRRWLADRLIESTEIEERERKALLEQASVAINEMRIESETNGNADMSLNEIDEEIRQTRLARKNTKSVLQ